MWLTRYRYLESTSYCNLVQVQSNCRLALAYRSRAVREPRKIMSEFGLELEEDVEVRVVDSNSELRFLVIPRRPAGTENWSKDELANLVTRDSMIGVSAALSPTPADA